MDRPHSRYGIDCKSVRAMLLLAGQVQMRVLDEEAGNDLGTAQLDVVGGVIPLATSCAEREGKTRPLRRVTSTCRKLPDSASTLTESTVTTGRW